MQKVQLGHDRLSLFGMSSQPQALNNNIANHGLAKSLISAFFIILAVGLILGVTTRILGIPSSSIAAMTIEEEKVAFTPGQFVSSEISRGYLKLR